MKVLSKVYLSYAANEILFSDFSAYKHILTFIMLKSLGAFPKTSVLNTLGPKPTLKNKSEADFNKSPLIEFMVIWVSSFDDFLAAYSFLVDYYFVTKFWV